METDPEMDVDGGYDARETEREAELEKRIEAAEENMRRSFHLYRSHSRAEAETAAAAAAAERDRPRIDDSGEDAVSAPSASDTAVVDEDEKRLPPARSHNSTDRRIGGDEEASPGQDAIVSPSVPSPSEKDPYEVVWDGGDADPLCPRSMSTWRKWMLVAITCMGSTCVTCASSIYTSSYDGMDAEFHSSRIVATLGLSTFVLGIALGPAWSPLSEFYGRRPIYIGSFLLFTVWIIPSAVAQNMATMIVARFFQGFTGSAFLSVSGGTVGDLFTRDTMQAPMAVFSCAPFIGPSVGPLVGGFINSYASWRWTHYVLIIWSVCELALLVLLVPETYHPVLLRNKAHRLRRTTGDGRWHAPLETAAQNKSIARTVGWALLRPFQLLASEPMCLALDLYSALLLGVLYLFFGAFPLVFVKNHGFNLWQTGLSFMGLFVGIAGAGMLFWVWAGVRDRLIARRRRATGNPAARSEPEDRLPSLMVGTVLVPIGLFMFGWTSYPSVPWILPIIGSSIFALGWVDAYELYAASALAGNAFVRCLFAAAFPLFGVQMYEKLGDQWATSLLAFLSLAMMPFPFLFFKYGKTLRGRSKYAVS
ncbi:major facilitator superfamily transporter multidrug resistance [Niveomyces insectorum RCEF 264]|uniref:Major facilitator superfamily transporter multidrug resistance n=1 Tax=Niveomyces insectorum RCEF 264 TaxID=1081102 RepID=A0A167XNX4_9HYPO|nr:major facilitator superfamily transporter multidrug resistance [Niveomyces insectorum RCEF 264]